MVDFTNMRARLLSEVATKLESPSLREYFSLCKLTGLEEACAALGEQGFNAWDVVGMSSEDLKLYLKPGHALRIARARNPIALIEHVLIKANKFMFLVMDEFQLVYTGGFPDGKDIIGETLAIGESTSGRIHCVLSGSCSELRMLAFKKWAPDQMDKVQFPNYTGIDLNITKYSATWILPLSP
eukprot:m.246596 g.246596  ORF g.246596 m.246596 type:complete len:183 (+) comp15097_c0_seq1:489-1037(+)